MPKIAAARSPHITMCLQGADKRARLAWVHAGRQPLVEQGRANSSPRSTATPWFLLLSFCSSDSSLVRHRPHSGAHRTADEAQSEEGNFAVILLGGDKIRTGHRCSNAAHLNHRLTLSTLPLRRMDIDTPRPRCPFCGLPMRFRFSEYSTLQTFDCKGCRVVLNIPPQADVLEIVSPALARG